MVKQLGLYYYLFILIYHILRWDYQNTCIVNNVHLFVMNII